MRKLIYNKIWPIITAFAVFLTVATLNNIQKNKTADNTNAETAAERFSPILDTTFLVYDVETKIVYIMISEDDISGNGSESKSCMSPYYAPNGKPYRYIDGELKEIEE